MTESTVGKASTTVAEKAVVNRAAKAAGEVSKALPTVVETAELAVEVPSKVMLNQKMIVAVSVVGGAVLGAGVLFGVNKLRERMAKKKVDGDVLEEDIEN
jgi:ABC-type proline/glycine betaine transport system permease subunit